MKIHRPFPTFPPLARDSARSSAPLASGEGLFRRVRWLGGLLVAGAVMAQEAPKPAVPPVPEPVPPEAPATPPVRSIEGTPAPGTAAPAPGDSLPAAGDTAPSAALLPDIPPGSGFPFSVKDIEKRKAIPYQEASTGEIESQIEAAWDEVSDRRISLIDAVRIALLNDPQIRLAEEDLQIAMAARTIARGSFDPRLATGVTYERRNGELSEAEIAQNQQQFDRNKALVKATREERAKLAKEITQLENGETPDNATKEGQLEQELNQAALDILKQLGIDAGVDVSALDKIGEEITKQGIQTRKDVLKILDSTERNAIKQNRQFPVISVRRTETTSFDMSIIKQFRNGIVIEPYVQYNNAQTNLQRRAGVDRVNQTEVGLDLTIPLGRGRGTIAASGHEMAAQIDVEASQLSLQHTVAERVLAVASAYWNLAAAQEQLGYLVRSEVTSTALSALTGALIKADEVPAASASQSLARRAQATANRIQGELTLQEAQQTLALAMGVGDEAIIFAPLASDRLPSIVSESAVKRLSIPDLVQGAFERRADYRSSRKAIDSGKLLSEQARLNVKPRVDLSFGMFYTGRDEEGSKESYYHAFLENQAGPGFMMSLRMDWPFFLNDARGNYALRQADLEIRRQQSRLINNQIVSGITRSHFVLKTSARELRQQEETVAQYEQALATERERFRLGIATLLDPIQTEERLTSARSQLVFSRLLHAQALVRLRFETGTLMPHDQADRTQVSRSALVTLPVFGPAPVDDVVTPRSGLENAAKRIFGETDPHRVLPKIDAREQREAAKTKARSAASQPPPPTKSGK